MAGVQPQNGIPGFSLHFPKELSYGYLRKVHWENGKKKSDIMKSGLDAMPLFLLDDLLTKSKVNKEGLSEHLKLK